MLNLPVTLSTCILAGLVKAACDNDVCSFVIVIRLHTPRLSRHACHMAEYQMHHSAGLRRYIRALGLKPCAQLQKAVEPYLPGSTSSKATARSTGPEGLGGSVLHKTLSSLQVARLFRLMIGVAYGLFLRVYVMGVEQDAPW